jgi:hypothetical protein
MINEAALQNNLRTSYQPEVSCSGKWQVAKEVTVRNIIYLVNKLMCPVPLILLNLTILGEE